MRHLLLLAFLALLAPVVSLAQPVNDNCADASLLIPGVPQTSTLLGATEEFGATAADGVDENSLSAGVGCFKPANTVWFKFRTDKNGGSARVIVSELGCLGGIDKDADIIGAIFQVDAGDPCNHTLYTGVADLGGGIQSCRGFQQGNSASDFIIGATGLAANTEYYVLISADRVITGFTEVDPAECDFTIEVEGDVTGAPDCLNDISTNGAVIGNCTAGGSDGSVVFDPKGSGNYRLLWEGAEQPSGVMEITGLANGVYDAIIFNEEDSDCQVDTNIVIKTIASVVASFSETQASCNASDGDLTVNLSGGKAPFTFLWEDGQTDQTAINLGRGDYVVTVSFGNGCTTDFTGTVTEPDQMSATTAFTSTSCFGTTDGTASVAITGGVSDPNYEYLWSDGSTTVTASGLAAGDYTVTATDPANSCFVIAEVTVTEPDPVTVTAVTTDPLCEGGQSGEIVASATGGTTTVYSYVWSDGSVGQQNNFLAAGTYGVTATDLSAAKCAGSNTFTLSEPAAITITFASTSPTCSLADDGQLVATVAGGSGGPYAYEWLGQSNTTDTLSNIGPDTYGFRATDLNNCKQTETVELTPVVDQVTADFSMLQPSQIVPSTIDFQNESSDATDYTWSFDNWDTSTLQDPTFTFDTAGEYIVQLIAYQSAQPSCADTAYQTITVLDTSSITERPTVFTPNGDGYNDEFTPGSTGMSEYAVSIYNRYGELLYSWVGPEGAWYGYNFSGELVPQGTYYYLVSGTGYDGVAHEVRAGYVTLLR